ncbi:DEAD/DEAH box helicase [Bacteriovoracaceae bacterium]|nr:DEAD/DEAH box helicase [Bacteriovoracaceae bacterium]
MYQLRPYQQQAVDYTIRFFKTKREPAVIVLPTGAGKSLVIAELARVAKGRVLVLAHVKELVEQNYLKYQSYNQVAGIFSAGLGRKNSSEKVIFGSIQSVARADDAFFKDFSLVIIDECHRVNSEGETQYGQVIKKLISQNQGICILGLTATPYRVGTGWIYKYGHNGEVHEQQNQFFHQCVFELPLDYMIKNKFLTKPIKLDIPVTSYDFSELTDSGRLYSVKEVDELLNQQKRLTPLIIKNIVDIVDKYKRQGVMIFSSTVRHAKEVLELLPEGDAKIVLGEMENDQRDQIINEFKAKKIKYLVNVSVLTTGFDAPHVDVIAILRPTESVSLYQQIIGRGLRLSQGKTDCYILDYTGMGHDIYSPEISDQRPTRESVPVIVECPSCGMENNFWGIKSPEGDILEHYGRKCRGGEIDPNTMNVVPCGHRFRLKVCPKCGGENDITARECSTCSLLLIDADSKLRQARLSKDAFILRPDTMKIMESQDKKGNPYLEIKYYDVDAKYLREIYYLGNSTNLKKFSINFLRSHLKDPELTDHFEESDDVIKYQKLFRRPKYVIARKQDKFWKITEKIFVEELSRAHSSDLS